VPREPLATSAEVAAYLGVAPKTLDDWAYRDTRAAAKLVDQQYVRLIHIAVTSGLRAANRAAAQSGLGGAGPVLWRMPAG
jgi:hypothetical protein